MVPVLGYWNDGFCLCVCGFLGSIREREKEKKKEREKLIVVCTRKVQVEREECDWFLLCFPISIIHVGTWILLGRRRVFFSPTSVFSALRSALSFIYTQLFLFLLLLLHFPVLFLWLLDSFGESYSQVL